MTTNRSGSVSALRLWPSGVGLTAIRVSRRAAFEVYRSLGLGQLKFGMSAAKMNALSGSYRAITGVATQSGRSAEGVTETHGHPFGPQHAPQSPGP